MNKNVGQVEMYVPIPYEEFESHRQFHYLYPDRHSNGKRIVSSMSFLHWEGKALFMVHAESPIKRIKDRRSK